MSSPKEDKSQNETDVNLEEPRIEEQKSQMAHETPLVPSQSLPDPTPPQKNDKLFPENPKSQNGPPVKEEKEKKLVKKESEAQNLQDLASKRIKGSSSVLDMTTMSISRRQTLFEKQQTIGDLLKISGRLKQSTFEKGGRTIPHFLTMGVVFFLRNH